MPRSMGTFCPHWCEAQNVHAERPLSSANQATYEAFACQAAGAKRAMAPYVFLIIFQINGFLLKAYGVIPAICFKFCWDCFPVIKAG